MDTSVHHQLSSVKSIFVYRQGLFLCISFGDNSVAFWPFSTVIGLLIIKRRIQGPFSIRVLRWSDGKCAMDTSVHHQLSSVKSIFISHQGSLLCISFGDNSASLWPFSTVLGLVIIKVTYLGDFLYQGFFVEVMVSAKWQHLFITNYPVPHQFSSLDTADCFVSHLEITPWLYGHYLQFSAW